MPSAPPIHNDRGQYRKPFRTGKTKNKSTTQRGYGWRWQQKRERIIARDMGLCQPCKQQGVARPFDHVDHKTPKAAGGTDDDANLQCICAECHKAKTAREDSHWRG